MKFPATYDEKSKKRGHSAATKFIVNIQNEKKKRKKVKNKKLVIDQKVAVFTIFRTFFKKKFHILTSKNWLYLFFTIIFVFRIQFFKFFILIIFA